MSEREFTPVQKDERNEVARLEAQLAKAKFDASQKESFGKFDVTVPNEGEDSYQSYLDKRPKDGVVRDGDSLRNTATGKYASDADYTASNGTTTEYFNAQVERSAESQVAYADMTLQDLARKYGESEAVNDKTTALDVLEALDVKMNEKAEANGWSKETKDLHYNTLMDIADKASMPANVEAHDDVPVVEQKLGYVVTPELEVEAANDKEVIGIAPDDTEAQDGQRPANDGESLEEYEARNGVKIDTLADVKLASLPEDISKIDTLEDINLAEVPTAEDEKLDTSGLDVEEQSIWERIRKGTQDRYLKVAALFGTAMYAVGGVLPQPSQKMGETTADFEKRVRRIGFAKVVGLVAVVVAAKYGLDHLNTGHSGGSSLADHATQAPGHYSTLDSQDIIVQPAVPEFSTAAHTVTGGEGWYNTFKEIGVTSAKEQANLLQKVGPKLQEMGFAYKMPHGQWGISHTGQLPENVLELINNSR